MKRSIIFLITLLSLVLSVPESGAQIVKRAEEFLQSAFEGDSTGTTAQTAEERLKDDSIKLRELTLQLQEMKLQDMMLRSELDKAQSRNQKEDSLRKARQLKEIDSLRNVTAGVPVAIERDTLFLLYASMGGRSAFDRAQRIIETLDRIAKDRRIRRDSVYSLANEYYVDIMYGDHVIMSVTEQDALWQGTTKEKLTAQYIPIFEAKIEYLKDENSFWQIVKRAGLFILVITLQYLIFKLINFLFRKLRRQIIRFKQQKMKALVVRDYELLNTHRLSRVLIFLSNLLRYFILLLVLIFTVPILFSIFPQTENLALEIFHYIIDPVRMVVKSVVEYIPNLFIIAVIWYCVRYIVKGIRYIAGEIEQEKLRISGFYPEWAQPTFNIVRFLMYAFMIAMIYPYLPGAHSGVFQGISVFVGLIVSLGSSTVISNFIAGFVITYMRPFKRGDFIKVQETVGNVIEKTPFVTRLRTIKNEVVTIPNSFIMSSDTVNYSASARKYGLIIHTAMTMGYDVPWRKVHDLLIKAALRTPGVLQEPKPFVLEMELSDSYMCYQINAYIHNADDMPWIKSDLLQNIQDDFIEAGIDLVCTHFYDSRNHMEKSLFETNRESRKRESRSYYHQHRAYLEEESGDDYAAILEPEENPIADNQKDGDI